MTKFDYTEEFGYSADELREAVADLSEQTGKQKREIWHGFIAYANKNLDDLKAYYARDVEHKRLMDAGRGLFTDDGDEAEDDES